MKSQFISKITASILCSAFIPVLPAASENSSLKDSGISYTESVGTINNPGAGYTQTIWAVCKPGNTPIYSPTGNIVLFFIDIGAFSSGMNEEKIDYDLDDAFFDSWRKTFENARNNGCMIALRLRYDAEGADNPEPATFEQTLNHVRQLRDSGLLEEYKDILAFVESGLVGKWGEQHGGKYTSVDYKAQVLDTMLECVPSPVPVTVRTPDTFARWAGIERKDLADYQAEPGSDAARVGLYNDGYMGSDSDLGTYANRDIETKWLGSQTINSYFGGEFSGNLDWAQKYDTYLPENAITEMYNTHLSYINANIFQLYKNYTFSKENDISQPLYQTFGDSTDLEKTFNHSAYYGQTVFQFIRDHIGYRFVLRKSELSENVEQGGQLNIHFKVENTGFANPIPDVKAELLLERDGNFMRTGIDIDPNQWRSCTVADENISAKLPDSLPVGKWNAYIKLTMGENSVYQTSQRSVQFANDGVWNAALGANYAGSFNVTESDSHGTDNFLRSASDPSDRMFSVNGRMFTDGLDSFSGEWTEDMLIAENGSDKLYMTADDKYFYIKGILPGGADAPVYNLRVENAETDRAYWIYFASNGYVYFNNGSYDDSLCKWNGDIVEFRIPLGTIMDLAPGTSLKSIRIFLQDSANDWKLTGEAKSGECTVPSNFVSYASETDIRLSRGDEYTLRSITLLESPTYQWYHNDEPISGANGAEYTFTASDSSDEGRYSVKITSASGVEKEIVLCNLLEVKDSLAGDINNDGIISAADLVLMQRYILGKEDFSEDQFARADMDSDNLVNAFDLVLLRKELIKIS